ncbi:MAG: hypothetical protein AB7P20_07785 [Rhizobiaceae bacterium]
MTNDQIPHRSLDERLANYTPSKKVWFWSVVGSSMLTMIVGFTVGGWTTGGSATHMAWTAARDARAELAAATCVQKFIDTDAASDNLASLKALSVWQQDNFVMDGGWARIAGHEEPIPGAAEICAKRLAAMDQLPEPNSVAVKTSSSG